MKALGEWGTYSLDISLPICDIDSRHAGETSCKILDFLFYLLIFSFFFFLLFFFVSRGSLDPIASSIKTCQRTTPSVL